MFVHHHLVALAMLMQNTSMDPMLLTVAEKSNYTATARSDEVIGLIKRIKSKSDFMQVRDLGVTIEGRSIPLLILANPPIHNAENARATSIASGKPICFIMANIHAGEVEGKEACLMLAREIALDPRHPFLKDLIIVIAPNYNADGNDKFDDVAKNRPGQIGPAHCGVRPNSEGLDLNRDYIKAEAPETQALIRLFNEWDPHITIDCHTTNGSHHRYTLTYDAPLNPSGHAAPIEFVRHQLLPEVTRRVKQSTGYDMWFYGNFSRDHTVWETYSAQPRFGGSYQGLRNQMSVLSEAYSYAPYKDRIVATREFVREILQYVAENKVKVIEINRLAREEITQQGANPQASDVIGIRHKIAAYAIPAIVLGYENATGGEGGATANLEGDLGPFKDYSVVHCGRFDPTLSVVRPFAYIIPPSPDMANIMNKLQLHGIRMEPAEGSCIAQIYTVKSIERAKRAFQGHHEVTADVESNLQPYTIEKGSFLVPTAQPLGTLAVYLLEPQSEDGLVTWNFFDKQLKVGTAFPVVRVRAENDLEKR